MPAVKALEEIDEIPREVRGERIGVRSAYCADRTLATLPDTGGSMSRGGDAMRRIVKWAWAPCWAVPGGKPRLVFWLLPLVVLGMASAGEAQEATAGVHIWYRGTQGCPDGPAFVARLEALGRSAQLAHAGDPVDFLVSVSSSGDGSTGRLERQTERGQMAIRELAAPRCEQVTDGLALSLDLALDPDRSPSPSEAHRAQGPALLIGAEATLVTGLVPAPLPGVALFAELAGPGAAPALRLEARGASGGGSAAGDVELHVDLLGARLEGCPIAWQQSSLTLGPCAALDIGALWASSSNRAGRSDRGFWASGSVLGRALWQVEPRLALGLQAGVALPFVRYDMGANAATPVFQTRAVGVEVALGAAWQLE